MSKRTHAAILALILSPAMAFASQGSGTGGDSASLQSQGSGTGGDMVTYMNSQGSGTGGDYYGRLQSQGSGTGSDSVGGSLAITWSYARQVYLQQMSSLSCITNWSCLFEK